MIVWRLVMLFLYLASSSSDPVDNMLVVSLGRYTMAPQIAAQLTDLLVRKKASQGKKFRLDKRLAILRCMR